MKDGFGSLLRKYIVGQFEFLLNLGIILLTIGVIIICINLYGFGGGIIYGCLVSFFIVVPTFGMFYTILEIKDSLRKMVLLMEDKNKVEHQIDKTQKPALGN